MERLVTVRGKQARLKDRKQLQNAGAMRRKQIKNLTMGDWLIRGNASNYEEVSWW